MADYDASVRVNTDINNSKFIKGAEQVEKKLDDIGKASERSGVKTKGNFDSLSDKVEDYKTLLKDLRDKGFGPGDEKFDNLYIAWKNAADAEREYLTELEKATEKGKAEAAEKAAKEAEKQAEQQRKLEEIAERNLQRENKILEVEAAKEAKLKAEAAEQERLAQIRANAVVSNQNLVDLLKEQEYITERMADLKRAGVADGYQEYDGLKERLGRINDEVRDMQSGYSKAANSAQKCFAEMQKGTNKTNRLFGALKSRLQGIALSLLVFNWISKGFNAMVSSMQAGFQNLAHYSEEYNKAMSDMKSESATLKNSLAAAFEPIATMIIPYITTLISWLNTAMNYLAQFWAALSGKSTYTRAKKQVVDYAKSLKDASGSAKGALAAFDEINVLNKDNGGSAGGGEVTGADAFEEVEVDQDKFKWVDWLKDNLDIIKTLVGAIGVGILAWKVADNFVDGLDKLAGIAIAAGGAFIFVKNAVDAWKNGIDWGNLSGMLIGATLLVAGLGLAFGGVGATIGALIAGIGLLVVGFKDIMEKGANLKNSLAVIAGTFLAVSSVAGTAVGAIAALVAGLVLAIAADWEDFKCTVVEPLKKWYVETLDDVEQFSQGVKNFFLGIGKFLKGNFIDDAHMAGEGLVQIFSGAFNAIVGIVKIALNTVFGLVNTLINSIVGAINAVINAINSLDFTVPDWVPYFGGNTYGGFNIPGISLPNIPYLEYGGTVTQETYAKISEGNRREVVLPLEQHTEWADIVAERIGSNRPTIIRFEGSLAELGRVLKPVIDSENDRVGPSLV